MKLRVVCRFPQTVGAYRIQLSFLCKLFALVDSMPLVSTEPSVTDLRELMYSMNWEIVGSPPEMHGLCTRLDGTAVQISLIRQAHSCTKPPIGIHEQVAHHVWRCWSNQPQTARDHT